MVYRTPEESRWAGAIERGAFGVWDLDPRLETVHYSPQWKLRLGFPRIDAPDSSAFWRCRVHPDDVDPMLVALRAHLDGDTPTYERRFRLRSNGSGYRTVLSRGRVVARDNLGGATRMVGTMFDLTMWPAHLGHHGLAREGPAPTHTAAQLPFHAVLGVAQRGRSSPAVGAPERHRLVESIDDLLDLALREAHALHRRPGQPA
jgi:hypothetical protein